MFANLDKPSGGGKNHFHEKKGVETMIVNICEYCACQAFFLIHLLCT